MPSGTIIRAIFSVSFFTYGSACAPSMSPRLMLFGEWRRVERQRIAKQLRVPRGQTQLVHDASKVTPLDQLDVRVYIRRSVNVRIFREIEREDLGVDWRIDNQEGRCLAKEGSNLEHAAWPEDAGDRRQGDGFSRRRTPPPSLRTIGISHRASRTSRPRSVQRKSTGLRRLSPRPINSS